MLASHHDRHCEYEPNVVGQHGRTVGRPTDVSGVVEVDDQNRCATRDRLQAWTLAEGELQLVIPPGERTAGAQGSRVGAVEDQRDGCGVDVEQIHARLAQTVGRVYPSPAFDGGEKLLVDRHI